ncbi:MAG: hypothetical protein HOC24_07615 [Deltaproteobacteria bacterium]|jgi:hypothetical protein|nr:hypothetical protein [Deltaproteobacteria bacterium]
MGKIKISEKVRLYFNWFDDHPNCTTQEMYSAFPKENENTMRNRKMKYLDLCEKGIWPEKENESTDTIIDTSTKGSNQNTSIKESDSNTIISENGKIEKPDSSLESNQEKEIDTSTNKSIDTFIKELFDRKETIMEILNGYQKSESLPLEKIKLEKPFKTVSFNLMEKAISDFSKTCEKLGISQRKAVHIALSDFIKKHDTAD